TSSSRLTVTKPAATNNRPSKLPVASKKRRFSTIKATAIPVRSSPRLLTSRVELDLDMQTTPTTDLPQNTAMNSSSPVPSFPDPIVPPTGNSDMRLPHTEDIHAHQQMPSWIQDIYSQLSAHATHLQTHSSQINEIQDLLKRNRELQMALDQANLRIAELEAASKTPTPISSATTTSPSAVPPTTSEGSSASKWADLVATPPKPADPSKKSRSKASTTTNSNGKQPAPQKKANRSLTLAQLTRFYSAPSESHGYRFLYFTSRGREKISKIRKGLKLLDLQQSRILDIHYPDNKTIGFLVHNDYASTVVDAMATIESTIIPTFDPCSPTLLRDPKYTACTDSEYLTSEATRIFQERLIRIVKRIHIDHVQLAVAREFCFQRHWLTTEQYHDLYQCLYPGKASKTSSSSTKDDVAMNDAPSDTTDSQTAASSTSSSPADGVSAPSL
ncbi:hypothetical protein PS6_011512, partial [Mucor atramentarius]